MGGRDERAALQRFLCGEQAAQDFHHRDHLAAAFGLVRLVPFLEAAALFSRSLKTMALHAGAPGAYHETITLAFLALVAERAAAAESADFATFLAANPDLEDQGILRLWYGPHELKSPIARRQFVLPAPRRRDGITDIAP
jgi:hypothetical protein